MTIKHKVALVLDDEAVGFEINGNYRVFGMRRVCRVFRVIDFNSNLVPCSAFDYVARH